ncbi:MAG: DUF262 domain-containing protein [Paludibacteraceae bacterium]|nr:DUF262 domain-containing protein [Paludibacteraceae bacterium]
MKKLSYTLWQIASWTSDDSEVLIPALQRGLVWQPRQVELLWDSILRGFPIGSFLLSDIVNNDGSGGYYLMDGQQRYNAISIGFNTVKDSRAVLWIDLLPPSSKKSTRKFWIKATTIPHPWGFKNDDDANRLNASEKRNALNEFNLKGNIYNNQFSLKETWPVEANLPVPLFCLLEAAEKSQNDVDTFVKEVLTIFDATDFSFRVKFNEKIKRPDTDLTYLRKILFPAFCALKDYIITCNHLPKDVLETETTEDSTAQTTLEVLFTRLNTGGTSITRDDLNYSAIKAYWPTIKDENDKLANRYMSPAKLVMLAFRLALTTEDDKNFKGEMTINQIRSVAKNDDERLKIEALYSNHNLENILEKVDSWLGVKENNDFRTPSILRTIIARNSPEVYLFLMYLAQKDIESPLSLSVNEIRALAFLLHWFGNDDKKKCVQEIYQLCKKGINMLNILKGISQLMHDCNLLHVYSTEEVRMLISIGEPKDWRLWDSLPAPAKQFFNRTFWYGTVEAKQMLLYSERQYLNTHFRTYDPARQDLWAEENRPWDFDHIVPQEWMSRRGPFHAYDKEWLGSIGNMAAISFEANRSKRNLSDFIEYKNNIESLCYLQDVESLKSNITYSKDDSIRFAKLTYERYCKIYAAAYNVIRPVVEKCVLPDTLQERKNIICSIMESLPDARPHFAADDGNDHWIEREQDWAREWIGVGIIKGEFMACFEWSGYMENDNPKYTEIGIRKAPGTSVSYENISLLKGEVVTEGDLNQWWYEFKECERLEASYIVGKLKELFDLIPNKSN